MSSAAAAAALLRSTALRRPASSSFRRGLFGNKEQRFSIHTTPSETALSRNDTKVVERTFLKLDEIDRLLDRRGLAIKRLGDTIRRNRRRRLLVRASLLGGAIYMIHHFFGGRSQDNGDDTQSKN